MWMVARRRWTIEESFQTGKGLTGLDEHHVRRWTSWYRWTTLAMLAHAFLTAVTAHHRADHPAAPELVPLTLGETRRLLVRLLIQTARSMTDLLRWSRWRRRHQARARVSHYRRQALYEP
ncbi:hypothetical protein IMZ11_36720 [Microtetraspora sp. AC03309]|uniref:hypothetical protein n=1 Tax=Microtetraspora sp. AC03309 TaxID=2779376 RepID=UPI0035B00ED9|nr:hypothetical protein [Microtetraspora sp. AC03309]